MSLDTWSLVVVAVFALLGLWRGAARQLASAVALVCASFASRPLSEVLGPWLAERYSGLSLSTAMLLGFGLAFFLIGLTAYVMVFFSIRPRRQESTEHNPLHSRLDVFWNRSLGLSLGALKGALLLWLLLSTTALMARELNFHLPWNLEDSRVYAFVQQHNAFNHKQWEKLRALEKISQLPPYATQLLPAGSPSQLPKPIAQELEKLQKLFNKPEFSKALDNKQWKAFLKDKELDKLLLDESFSKALNDFRNFSKTTGPPARPPSSEKGSP